MSETAPHPLYKIFPASAAPPNPTPLVLPLSSLDSNDGFIHLSTASQTAETANLFFADETTLLIGKIPLDRLKINEVKWEVEGSPGCAHLYNGRDGMAPKLGSDEIADVKEFRRGDGDWKEQLAGDGWLEG